MSRPIGILGGTGPAGMGLGLRWARAGETVIIGSRSAERAPRDTVTPRSGTRHRAVSEPPPKATSRREAVSSTMVPGR